jgi:hypothetical protein
MIYTVTVVQLNDGGIFPKGYRTWGYYFEESKAVRAVYENHTDIFEDGYYTLALVQEIPEGVMAVPERTRYFQYEDHDIREINCPDCFKNFFVVF